jgi:two-component system chemotaxis response regulator CheY
VEDFGERPDGGWILVVEDDADVRGEVRVALEGNGYAVLEAQDGREALEVLFAESKPDVRLIISDLTMPKMSGSEMLQVLSSYSRSSRIPVVVVSGTHPPARPKPHEAVADWLVKPFDMQRLLDVVESHSGRRDVV